MNKKFKWWTILWPRYKIPLTWIQAACAALSSVSRLATRRVVPWRQCPPGAAVCNSSHPCSKNSWTTCWKRMHNVQLWMCGASWACLVQSKRRRLSHDSTTRRMAWSHEGDGTNSPSVNLLRLDMGPFVCFHMAEAKLCSWLIHLTWVAHVHIAAIFWRCKVVWIAALSLVNKVLDKF